MKSFGYIYARKIYRGDGFTIDDVPAKYRAVTIECYIELYGHAPTEAEGDAA